MATLVNHPLAHPHPYRSLPSAYHDLHIDIALFVEFGNLCEHNALARPTREILYLISRSSANALALPGPVKPCWHRYRRSPRVPRTHRADLNQGGADLHQSYPTALRSRTPRRRVVSTVRSMRAVSLRRLRKILSGQHFRGKQRPGFFFVFARLTCRLRKWIISA